MEHKVSRFVLMADTDKAVESLIHLVPYREWLRLALSFKTVNTAT
jgi:hypothetical protein